MEEREHQLSFRERIYGNEIFVQNFTSRELEWLTFLVYRPEGEEWRNSIIQLTSQVSEGSKGAMVAEINRSLHLAIEYFIEDYLKAFHSLEKSFILYREIAMTDQVIYYDL